MLGGLMGVGGGAVLVPMLVGLVGLRQHQAHGTSLAIIIPIGLFGGISYALHGHVDWLLAGWLALGSIVGVVVGARLMARVPARRLGQGFGIFLLLMGLRLLLWGA